MDNNNHNRIDLDAIRAKLAGKKGPQYWRSLEELAETPEFEQFLQDEFPNRATLLPLDRRSFLKVMGASLALAGLAGCRYQRQEKIIPFVKAPEDVIPGKPLQYATAHTLGTDTIGLLVTSYEGRPTKIEGNPSHPNSLGATDALAQASVLNLYDPDRSQNVTERGEISTWSLFLSAARQAVAVQKRRGGAGLRILTETTTSPTLAAQMAAFLKAFPQAKWHHYDPVGRSSARAALGDVNVVYGFTKADVILSLDADFLLTMPNHVRYASDFADRRRVRTKAIGPEQPAQSTMNRLYVAESAPTITGAAADHRLPLRASEVEGLARAVAQQMGVASPPTPDVGGVSSPVIGGQGAVPANWIPALVKDLQAHRGRSIVMAGDHQSPAVHALAHAMNEALGNIGQTVFYTEPIEALPPNLPATADGAVSLRELTDDMQAGRVEMLLILGGNPAYTAPADIPFAGALATLSNTAFTAHLSLYDGANNETSALCRWHLPEAHYLEAWSDARTFDGTASIVQPLIEPLFGGKSVHEVLAALFFEPKPGYDIVRAYWRAHKSSANFDREWQKWLNDGVIPGTQVNRRDVTVNPTALATQRPTPNAQRQSPNALEVIFRPDPTVWDGRFANNAWLQELPKPLTKLTWDNAALISPATAAALGLAPKGPVRTNEQPLAGSDRVVEISVGGRKLRAPIFLMPGHPDGAITLHLGYGRERAGRIGAGTGFNAYALRASAAPWFVTGAQIRATGETYQLVSTHYHNSMNMEGRDPILVQTLDEFRHPEPAGNAEEALQGKNPSITLFDAPEDYERWDGSKWAMSIDNSACIGCNACVVACQAENNIPVVGKDQVAWGREMHWIRIDRYYKSDPKAPDGGLGNPQTLFQPVPCMQCEKAPCEVVCPVAATTHSHEGLNQQIYNRCVGTRYCSNNCPYKVRRFNFYKYVAGQPNMIGGNFDQPLIKLQANPNVTVRGRGVMEKCSYCVQRINAARIESKKADRSLKDGDIQTACQQACPTKAIVFGDISDRNSRVSKLKAEPHDYSLLAELNTRPRTTYLKKLRNPNPEIEREV
jgi:MoCo/4Fe-4S cofactor protein with predicted Tat translocation signal